MAAGVIFGAGAWRSAPTVATAPERLTLTMTPPDGVRITGALALSPDARTLAFVGQGPEGPPGLWLRSMGDGTTRLLADTADAMYPFWSPRGDAIGFFAQGRLKTIGVSGGTARVLAAAPNGRGGTWGTDGTILFVPQPNNAVYRVADTGGTMAQVTTIDRPDSEVGHRFPQFIDADRYIFSIQAGRAEVLGVYLASLSRGRIARLVSQWSNAAVTDGHLLYVDNGAVVARAFDPETQRLSAALQVAAPVAAGGFGFSAFTVAGSVLAYSPRTGSGATSVSRWFDRRGSPLNYLGESSGLAELDSFYPTPSRSGGMISAGAFQGANSDLWIVDTKRDVASRFTRDAAPEADPVWSPDDTELVYASSRAGVYNLFKQSVVTPGVETRLTTSTFEQHPNDWTRDGRTLVVTQVDPETQCDIWIMPTSGASPGAPLLNAAYNEFAAALSPDNEWLAYTSDESGRNEVYMQRFPSGGDRLRLSALGGSHPVWRQDGRELYFLGADRRVYAVPLTPAAEGLNADRPVKLFDVPVDTTVGSMHARHLAVSGDGQRFLLSVSTISQTAVTVVQHWMPTRTGTVAAAR